MWQSHMFMGFVLFIYLLEDYSLISLTNKRHFYVLFAYFQAEEIKLKPVIGFDCGKPFIELLG